MKTPSPWLGLSARRPEQEAQDKFESKYLGPATLTPKAPRQFRMEREHHPGQAFGFAKAGLGEKKRGLPFGDTPAALPTKPDKIEI